MRVAAPVVVLTAALATAGTASASPAASCQTPYRVAGKQLIVIGKGVGCADAKAMMRSLLTAPVIGHVTRGGVQLLRLRSPRSGWTCATSTPIRARGAGCSKGALSVIYVKMA